MVRIEFRYEEFGFGQLKVIENDNIIFQCNARTGSINNGKLVKSLPRGLWYIKDAPVNTQEKSMIIAPDFKPNTIGWKIRLYNQLRKRTSYLIHPDGNKPGTLGCIGLFGMCWELKNLLGLSIYKQKEIKVYV